MLWKIQTQVVGGEPPVVVSGSFDWCAFAVVCATGIHCEWDIFLCDKRKWIYIYFFLLNWVQRGMFCLDHVKFWHALASPSQKNVRFESALFSLEKGEGYLAYLMLSHTLKSFFFFFFSCPPLIVLHTEQLFSCSLPSVSECRGWQCVLAWLLCWRLVIYGGRKARGVLHTPCYGEVCVFGAKPLSFWKLCVLSPEKRGVGVLFMVSCGSLCLWENV